MRRSFWFGVAACRDLPGLASPGVREGREAAAGRGGRDDRPRRPSGQDDDEKAIAALVASFTKAFNAGDAAAAAATYAETPSSSTSRASGPKAAPHPRPVLAASFADNPGSTIAIETTPCVSSAPTRRSRRAGPPSRPAAGPGRPRSPASPSSTSSKTASWLQSAVRDEHAHDLTPHDRLKELEWLVGDWINESQDAVVHTTCKWADDGNFLVREFTMKTAGPARPLGHAADRLGPDAQHSSRPGSSTPKAASARVTGPAPATSG